MLLSASASLIVGDRVSKFLNSAPTSDIPCIRKAAHAAIATIEFSQTAKKNQDDLVAIGKACCCVTARVIERSPSQDGKRARQEAQILRKEMKFVLKRVSLELPWWRRFFFSRRGEECTIQQCRDRLQNALESLGLRSDVELWALVAPPSSQAEEVSSTEEMPSPPPTAPPLHNLPTSAPDLPGPSQASQHPQHLSPIMYTHVQGSVSTTVTDSSCNVSGDKNNISFSST